MSRWYNSAPDHVLLNTNSKHVSHKDIIKLCHIKGRDLGHEMIFTQLTHGYDTMVEKHADKDGFESHLEFLRQMKLAPSVYDVVTALDYIKSKVNFKRINRGMWAHPHKDEVLLFTYTSDKHIYAMYVSPAAAVTRDSPK